MSCIFWQWESFSARSNFVEKRTKCFFDIFINWYSRFNYDGDMKWNSSFSSSLRTCGSIWHQGMLSPTLMLMLIRSLIMLSPRRVVLTFISVMQWRRKMFKMGARSTDQGSKAREFSVVHWIFRSLNGMFWWILRQKWGQSGYFWKVGAMPLPAGYATPGLLCCLHESVRCNMAEIEQ